MSPQKSRSGVSERPAVNIAEGRGAGTARARPLADVCFYLGVRVFPLRQATAPTGWCWAMWPDGRWFLFWADQLLPAPWGDR